MDWGGGGVGVGKSVGMLKGGEERVRLEGGKGVGWGRERGWSAMGRSG